MALPNEIHPFAIAGGGNQYQIANSLRFRSDVSSDLRRTVSSAGNRRTWTWSGWIKRSSLASSTNATVKNNLFAANQGSYADFFGFDVSTNVFNINLNNTYSINSTEVFRDPSAWYHIVVILDANNATAANRLIVYVNNSRLTLSGTIAQTDYQINTAVGHAIGSGHTFNGYYFNGYMAEVNFIDGYAYDPSYFGQTDSITGQWVPKKYTGTYGVNGFYLPFNNTSSTTALGFDYNPSPTVTSTVSGSNSITLSNAASKWGSVSLSLGSQSNKYISTTHNTNQYIYNTNFTIEFWYKGQASDTNFSTSQDGGILSGYNFLVSKGRTNSSNYGWGIQLNSDGSLELDEFYGGASAAVFTGATNLLNNSWHHVCVMRSGSSNYIFVDGVLQGSGTMNNNTNNSFNLLINGMFDYNTGSYPTYFCGGYIDDFRFYSGLVKYSTSGFTAPTAALGIGQLADPYWNYNILAYPFEGSNGATSFDLYAANAWTPSGISVTSGVTYDVMIDSPTAYNDGGNNRGNYPTLNPLSYYNVTGTLTNGNMSVSYGTTTNHRPTFGAKTGKWYAEITCTSAGGYSGTGLNISLNSCDALSTTATAKVVSIYASNGQTFNYNSASYISYGASWTTGDIIGVAFDCDTGDVTFYKNGVSQGTLSSPTTSFAAGGNDVAPFPSAYNSGVTSSFDVNYGQRPFTYTPPTGYKALNTYNLADPSLPLV